MRLGTLECDPGTVAGPRVEDGGIPACHVRCKDSFGRSDRMDRVGAR
jgi:hypothetical protein